MTRPNAPKFPRGGLRAPPPGPLESETVYRGLALEGDLSGAEALNAVTFQGCVFRQVNLTGVHWRDVRLTDVRFEGCDLSGARLEVVGGWRIDSDHLWLRNHCFGEAGSLVLALPSFEPEQIKAAAVTMAASIGRYLDTQLEYC